MSALALGPKYVFSLALKSVCFALMLFVSLDAKAQVCTQTDTAEAYLLGAESGAAAEIFGTRTFRRSFPNGLTFALEPQPYGWSIRVYNDETGNDLTSMTPPLRGVPNPRDISGWHFRNADNTGANDGSVNAPQTNRRFMIGGSPVSDTRDAAQGLGWLNVLDYGLADLQPGQKARMVYLKFDACLMVPKILTDGPGGDDKQSLVFTQVDRETFGKCGLDLKQYALKARFAPRMLGGDFDGDGSLDEATQIIRRSDQRAGLAICRAGTWLDLVGFEPDARRRIFEPFFISSLEAWELLPPEPRQFGYEGAPPWPNPDGDVLVLERIEKQMSLLFWKGKEIMSQKVYRYIEGEPEAP